MADCKFKVVAYRRELCSNKFLLTSRSDIPRVKDANRETNDNNGRDAEREYSGSDQLFTLASIISSVVRVLWIHLLLENRVLFSTLIVSTRAKCLLLEGKLLL